MFLIQVYLHIKNDIIAREESFNLIKIKQVDNYTLNKAIIKNKLDMVYIITF